MFEAELSEEEHYYKLENMVLSSYPVLRKVFQARWENETGRDWKPTREQGEKFVEDLGAEAYEKAENVQKTKIMEGNPEDWDLTILALVILNLGDWSTYKKENDSVKKLRGLRNLFAHRTSTKMPGEVYKAKLKVFRTSMKGLGVNEEEIEQIISTSGTTSSNAAFKKAKKLYDKAKNHMKKNQFQRAIERCNEAMQLPSLLGDQVGVTYENRGECYLKFAQHVKFESFKESNGYIEEAIRDGRRALELNDNSWKAHYLIGRCHRLKNNLKIATQHLTISLAISPNKKLVKEELCACKVDNGAQGSGDMFNPTLGPMTLNERVAMFEADTGRKVTRKQFVHQWKRKNRAAGMVPGKVYYMKGLQLIEGSFGLRKNEVEAVRYVTKAAIVGNPGGLHSLGLCYENGTGIERDMSKAFQYFLQGAELENSGSEFHGGIGACQEALGRMFEFGTYVEQDKSEAVKWYKKAADNGSKFAANNLGNLFNRGCGVSRDQKMAVSYWTQAVNSKDPLAALSLMDYYVSDLEPEKALVMLETLKMLGNTLLLGVDEDAVKREIEEVTLERDNRESSLIDFETENKLYTKGLTFMERIEREAQSYVPEVRRMNEYSDILRSKNVRDSGGVVAAMQETNTNLLRSKAQKGSVVAAAILETLSTSRRLIQFVEPKQAFSNKQKTQILDMLYDCATRQFEVVHFQDATKWKLKLLVYELVNTMSGTKGEEDMKIRFVHAKLNFKPNPECPCCKPKPSFSVELLKKGTRMYPDNLHYYELLSSICVYEANEEFALSYVKKGLEKFPGNVNLLFYKAFSQFHVSPEKVTGVPKKVAVIDAFRDFLKVAPKDHFKVPEAYYCMAAAHLGSRDKEMVEHYFKLGKEAEKNMLLPLEPSYQKILVENELWMDSFKVDIQLSSNIEIPAPLSVLQWKEYLRSPLRKLLITQHRLLINELSKKGRNPCTPDTGPKPKARQLQEVPDRMFQLKPIILKEMNPVANRVYEGRVMDLTIIDMPNSYCHCPAIHLLAEDENGDLTRLNIYNMCKSKTNFEELGFGAKVGVLNPYMHIAENLLASGIRIDVPDCIIYLGKVKNMCRFCGESVKTKNIVKCEKCRKAVYCSKECQELVWNTMKHYQICTLF